MGGGGAYTDAPEREEMAKNPVCDQEMFEEAPEGVSTPVSSPFDSYYPPQGPQKSMLDVLGALAV